MSEYIENRIKRLETRLGARTIDITANEFYIKELKERVKAIEEILGLTTEEPTEDHADQSTDEFVKVKHGEWRRVGARVDWVECTSCGYRLDVEPYTYPNTNYCPNCGAKMENVKE